MAYLQDKNNLHTELFETVNSRVTGLYVRQLVKTKDACARFFVMC